MDKGSSPGESAIAALEPPWRVALDEAWTSWRDGNFGIGAALHDPETDQIVSRGRNAIGTDPSGDLKLTGNWMAHAEMNVFADMGPFTARGLDLYTTLEPCIMCAGTAIFLDVNRVFFAAHDEYFDRLETLWDSHEYSRQRRPTSVHHLTGRLASFCRLLPLTSTFERRPDSPMTRAAERSRPVLSRLAASGAANDLRDRRDLAAAVDELWDQLPDDEMAVG